MENSSTVICKNKDNEYYNDISAIILSAGYSSRMGEFKPLLKIGGKTAIEREIITLKEVGIEQITTVIGYKKELLYRLLIDNRVRAVFNPRFEGGMFTSIQAGIRAALDTHIKGFLLMLVDCPLIPAEVIYKIIAEHRKHPDSFIVPCYRGKKGHPLLIPSIYAKEILEYDGPGGLKAVISKYDDKMIKLEVNNEAVVLDMDTQEGYEEILEYYKENNLSIENNKKHLPLESVADSYLQIIKEKGIKRLFLIRHGQIMQHKDKIFLGQTDITLSEQGKREASNAGKQLHLLDAAVDFIYTSDLSRTRETAQIILNELNERAKSEGIEKNIKIIEDPSLREMNLGPWDGKYIHEIKQQFPNEYEKRGQDILAYKYGNDSENFYDLQYRVVKGFKKILKNHESGDLVIVTHSGVIKVILANLHDYTLAEVVKKKLFTGQIIKVNFA
ncbi:histidine phosphatase family protein [Anaerovorax odorimutans]|uniref:histidine phosphatase family protein n=1 Tax=Anaerovorax odorimutans TaxID=109327 RepID=UPI0004137FE4|nr:histidine phosphatase family protein [Anaerovorax odorimutans]